MTDEFLNIDTPENVVFGYEVVGIGSRFMAALVDTTLILVLQLIANLTLFFIIAQTANGSDRLDSFLIALFSLIAFILFWGYYIFFELRWNGRSPGKQLVGIRVIRQDGTPITLAESVIRNLVRLVDFLPGLYGVGLVTMFIDGQSRRLGDLAANTLVVRDQADVTLESLRQTTRPTPPRFPAAESRVEAFTLGWPIERLTENDIQLAEDFLQRYHDLANRNMLAGQILRRLLGRMDVPAHTVRPSETLSVIERIVRAWRSQE